MTCIIKEGELNIRNTAQYSTIQILEYEVLGFLYWINTLIVSTRKKNKSMGTISWEFLIFFFLCPFKCC